MTDVLKDYRDSKATSVANYLKTSEGKDFEERNLRDFESELTSVRAVNAILVGFGKDVFDILERRYKTTRKIVRIDHYGYRITKEEYKARVHASLGIKDMTGSSRAKPAF